jgi:hypothetical protein
VDFDCRTYVPCCRLKEIIDEYDDGIFYELHCDGVCKKSGRPPKVDEMKSV